MKFLTLIFLSLLLTTCGRSSAAPDSAVFSGVTQGMVGRWISSCVADSTTSSNIIVDIADTGNVKLLFKSFSSDSTCSSSYEYISPITQQPTTELVDTDTLQIRSVENIPNNFFVIKQTSLQDQSVNYIVFYLGESGALHLFTGIANDYGTNWNDWILNVSALSAFVTDPVGSNSSDILHFSPTTEPIVCDLQGTLSRCRSE